MADDEKIPLVAPVTLVVLAASLLASVAGFLLVEETAAVTRHVGGDWDRDTALWVYPAIVAGLLVLVEIGRRLNNVAVVSILTLASIAVVVAQAIAIAQAT